MIIYQDGKNRVGIEVIENKKDYFDWQFCKFCLVGCVMLN